MSATLRLDYDLLSKLLGKILRCPADDSRFGRRALFASVVVLWGVPALTSYCEGTLLPARGLAAAFISDLSMYALFLFSLPVLLATASRFSRLQNEVMQSLQQEGVLAVGQDRYDATVEAANRWLRNVWVHAAVLSLACFFSVWWAQTMLEIAPHSWYGSPAPGGAVRPSLSLIYVGLFAMPLPLYTIFVWAYKAIVWNWFVQRVSRYGLKVNVLHPDRAGGIGLMRYSSLAWGTYIICVGLAIACDVFNYAYILDMSLHRWDILAKVGSYCILAPALFLWPLLCLTPHLARARMNGEQVLFAYALRYVERISAAVTNATRGETASKEAGLQKAPVDLRELTVLYEAVRRMRLWPFDLGSVVRMFATVLGPFLPLLLPRIPIIGKLVGLVTGS